MLVRTAFRRNCYLQASLVNTQYRSYAKEEVPAWSNLLDELTIEKSIRQSLEEADRDPLIRDLRDALDKDVTTDIWTPALKEYFGKKRKDLPKFNSGFKPKPLPNNILPNKFVVDESKVPKGPLPNIGVSLEAVQQEFQKMSKNKPTFEQFDEEAKLLRKNLREEAEKENAKWNAGRAERETNIFYDQKQETKWDKLRWLED